MKKLSFFFIALSFVAFISLNSCKTSTKPAAETEDVEEVVEEAVESPDTAAAMVDSTATEVEEVAEGAAE